MERDRLERAVKIIISTVISIKNFREFRTAHVKKVNLGQHFNQVKSHVIFRDLALQY